jgi:hypothetical protein
MNDFAFYFDLGWKHIISTDALDHQLFIATLASIYLAENWKEVLILVTAFTIGHSLTLALSSYNVIQFSNKWVEFLIPVTILITAITNFFRKNFHPASYGLQYFLALFFGLIHGLGFANTIRFMLAGNQSITIPLLGFNVGLEAGQIIVVAVIILLSFLFVNKLRLQRKY